MKDYCQVLASSSVGQMSKLLGTKKVSRKRKAKNLHHTRLTLQVDSTWTSSQKNFQMMNLTLKWTNSEIHLKLFLENSYRDPISEQWLQSKRAKIGKGLRKRAVVDASAQCGRYRTAISSTFERMTTLSGKIGSYLKNSLICIFTFAVSLYSNYSLFTTIV